MFGRPERRARAWALVALASAVLVIAMVGFPAQAATPSAKPTIVLVHRAFSGPSAWDQVAASLTKEGYATVAVALPLTGLAEDVDAVRAALDGIGGSQVLAAHSYGGLRRLERGCGEV